MEVSRVVIGVHDGVGLKRYNQVISQLGDLVHTQLDASYVNVPTRNL